MDGRHSNNSIEANVMTQPYVVIAESHEWVDLIQELEYSFHHLREVHMDEMFDISVSPDRDARLAKFEEQLQWFTDKFQEHARTMWNSHERINFYVYFDNMREMVKPAMDPWELDFALICK